MRAIIAATALTLTSACTSGAPVAVDGVIAESSPSPVAATSDAPAPRTCPIAPPGWRPMSAPLAPFAGSIEWKSAVWSGREMLALATIYDTKKYQTRAFAYAPDTDRWRELPTPPFVDGASTFDVATFDGLRWTLFAGSTYDGTHGFGWRFGGFAFDTHEERWSEIPAPPSTRTFARGAWSDTTRELLVFGGQRGIYDLADGWAWSPDSRTWRSMAAAPFAGGDAYTFFVRGSLYVVFPEHIDDGATPERFAAAYDPVLDAWTPLPLSPISARIYAHAHAFTGEHALFALYRGVAEVSDGDGAGEYEDGAYFAGNAWHAIPPAPFASFHAGLRYSLASWTAGSKLYVWGGFTIEDGIGLVAREDGAVFDTASNTWTALPSGGPPSSRSPITVFTGCDAVVFGEAGGALFRAE